MKTSSQPQRRNTSAPFDRHRLTRQRSLAGLSQKQLSDASGVSTQHISRLELGRVGVSPEVLHKLADGIGCPVKDLMPDEPADTPPSDVGVRQLRGGERAVPDGVPELPDARVGGA